MCLYYIQTHIITGKRIPLTETVQYDRRVVVKFQVNAWCDEEVMRFWVNKCWKPACTDSMLLVMDVHKAQKTEAIQDLLQTKCATDATYVPGYKALTLCIPVVTMFYTIGGCTSLIQPLDVCFNKPFKLANERLATEHMQDNLDAYVKGQFNASARRVLFTKWVGEAWEDVSANSDMVIRSFKKTGIALAVDGSEDGVVNIKDLEGYKIEESDAESEDEEYTDEDPFADCTESDIG